MSMGISNGTFDTDLSGWIPAVSGDADVIWDSGRARLRVYRCSNAKMEQNIVINGPTISFEWETKADNWWEGPEWNLILDDGTVVVTEGLPINRAATLTGSKTLDVSSHVGKSGKISFFITPSRYCSNFDHGNTYLWVDNVVMAPPQVGKLSFSSIPDGAEIFIDGQDQNIKTPATITDVPAGAHTYALKLANYNDYSGTIDVIKDQISQVSETLDVMEGCILFNTAPQGARIYIDEVDIPDIVTPGIVCGISLGSHTYKLVLADYTPAAGSVTLEAGTGVIISETLTHETGSISFNSVPDGAEIIIDGVDQLIATPAMITQITGMHDYILRKAGYNDYSGVITVSAGQIVTVEVALIPAEGCISFNISPAGAKIFIDNVDTGKVTPALICGLTPGQHTYRLSLTGYQDITGNVNLAAGQGTTITGTLPKKGMGTGTILGLGLLGAGILGAVIVATREKKPEYTLPGYKGG